MAKKIFPYLLLIIFTVLSSGQLLNMFFWHDDYTTLYLLQRGYLMWFPYHFTAILTKLFLPIFGLEPKGYFAIGIILYTSASMLLFKLIVLLIKDRKVALISTMIFAGGYIGQDEMKMFLGTGFGTIFALNFALLSLIAFHHYKATQSAKLLLISYLLFFLVLDVAPYRYAGFALLLISVDWIVFTNGKIIYKMIRSVLVLVISVIQYTFKPTSLLWGYPLSNPLVPNSTIVPKRFGVSLPPIPEFTKILTSIGSFWNMIYPFKFQYDFFHYTKNVLKVSPFIYSFIPLILILLPILIAERKKLARYIPAFIIFSSLWIYYISSSIVEPYSKISMASGGVFILFLLTLSKTSVPKFPNIAIFSLLSSFLILSTFYLTGVDYAMDSSNRYMLAGSFTIPLIFSSFFLGKGGKTNFLIVGIISLVAGLNVIAGISTKKSFVKERSVHARNIFSQMKTQIPSIEGKTSIFIEPTNNKLNHSVGDVFRVGALPSEAAIAVHYNTLIENITILDNLDGIQNDNVKTYIFSYNGTYLNKKQ